MKVSYKALFMVLPIISFTMVSLAQEELWNKLNRRANMLYQDGRYSEAAKIAEESLAVAEKTFGPDHPDVAASLNNLALLYHYQGRCAEAEPFYKQSLAIWEKALGPDHPTVAKVLLNLAKCYKKLGKGNEAKELEDRAQKIRSN